MAYLLPRLLKKAFNAVPHKIDSILRLYLIPTANANVAGPRRHGALPVRGSLYCHSKHHAFAAAEISRYFTESNILMYSLSMILKKWRLIINKDKHLGDLLLLQLAHGDHSLKFSLKNKIGIIDKHGPHYGDLLSADLENPRAKKEIRDGESLEVGYIFEKQKLEVKEEISGGSIERSFYEVTVPIEHHLFTVIIRDLSKLANIDPNDKNLFLNETDLGDQVALVFSFAGLEGKGFFDPDIKVKNGRTVHLDLENMPLNKLLIGITSNDHPLGIKDFLVVVPFKKTTKIS